MSHTVENEDNVAGASGGEQTPAPSVLDTWDHDDKPIQAQTEEAAAADEPEEGEPAEEAEASEGQPERTEDDDSPEEDEPKHRLRDGEEVPLGELKKVYGTRKEIEAAKAKLEADTAQFQQQMAAVRQQEQFFAQQMPLVLNALRQQVPPMPDPALQAEDPIAYANARFAHEDAVRNFQRAQAAAQAQQQQTEAQRQAALQTYRQTELQRLVEKEPALRDPAKIKQMDQEIREHIGNYGFSLEEYAGVDDHRALLILKDAVAYRKLMANKPKAIEKAKDAPPVVQAPARRRTSAEVQAQGLREQLSRLAKTGSAKDGEALLSRFE
jgi:hypothetical protein